MTFWSDDDFAENNDDWIDGPAHDPYEMTRDDWIIGVDFYACGACWQDTDSFDVEVMPGVYLRGELHRDPAWDTACQTSARLRLTDLRDFT